MSSGSFQQRVTITLAAFALATALGCGSADPTEFQGSGTAGTGSVAGTGSDVAGSGASAPRDDAGAGAGDAASHAGASNAGAADGGASGGTEIGGTASGGTASGGTAGTSTAGGGGVHSSGGSPAGGGGGSGGVGGGAGAPPTLTLFRSYTASAATKGAKRGKLSIGHEFMVTASNVHVRDLGVWDEGADGLLAAHTVTLFALGKPGLNPGAGAVPVAGGSVTVPAGSAAPLDSGFRFISLPSELELKPGSYAVVAYGMSDSGDSYGDGGNVPFSGAGLVDAGFGPFQAGDLQSPAFPNAGDQLPHASVSLHFSAPKPPFTRIMPLGASITDGYMGSNAGYRGSLATLLANGNYPAQFVGSLSDNAGTLPLDERHHEGHSGFTIQSLQDNATRWLGPTGSPADLVLLLVGTNDIVQNSDLSNAGVRLGKLLSTICDKSTGLLPKARVIVAQLPPLKNATWAEREVGYNQAVVQTVALHAQLGENVSMVDMHSALTLADLSSDGEHPNDAGYAKIAQVWFSAITKP